MKILIKHCESTFSLLHFLYFIFLFIFLFYSKKRDSWEASNPPSRDRSPHKYNDKFRSTTGRNETDPEKRLFFF